MVSGLDAEELAAHRRWAGRARTPERTPEAEQQIADARAEPTLEEMAAAAHDPQLNTELAQHAKDGRFAAAAELAHRMTEETWGARQVSDEPHLKLTGPRLAAYLRIEAAAKAAHAAQAQAQASLAATGQELREAFGELCKVVVG